MVGDDKDHVRQFIEQSAQAKVRDDDKTFDENKEDV